MPDAKDINEALGRLARENARLRGESLATGVILTQLLQSICRTELNPQGAATKIMKNAESAVEAFKPDEPQEYDGVMKESALEMVQNYAEQIRSVLRD